jgi:FKBP-type peptidyl-prolyl cis-trans isomerase SlyD
MNIQKNTIVTLHYKIFNQTSGALLDASTDPIAYLHGGYDGILPLVEEALHDKKVGDVVHVDLSIEDGFGEVDANLVRVEPLEVFPADIEVGMVFEADDEEFGDTLLFRVVSIENGHATIDANHPFAGQAIRFETEILEIRTASAEEVQHGHPHGEHGHHH